jgi:hypothetical protein
VNRDAVRGLILTMLGLGWLSASVAAGLAASPTSLLDLPWVQMAVGCLIAMWGGLARTAGRVLAPQDQPLRLGFEVIKDFLASILIGFIVFAFSAWQSWDVWLLAVALPLAGYGGARFLEPMSDALVQRLIGVLGRKETP